MPEPAGGAHVDHDEMFDTLGKLLRAQLKALTTASPAELLDARYAKFRAMGRLGQEFARLTPPA